MANRFWVGGSGTWDASTTTNWSATSGGAGGASAPTSADDTIFDTLSNATGYTVTLSGSPVCRSCTFGAPLTGTITLAGSVLWAISGNLTMLAGMTRTFTNVMSFVATSGTQLVTTNGVNMAQLTLNCAGATVQLQDNWTSGQSGGAWTYTDGMLDQNGKTMTYNASLMSINGAWTFNGPLTITGNATTTCALTLNSSITVTGQWTVTGNSTSNRVLVQSSIIGTARTITCSIAPSLTNCDFMDIAAAGTGGTWAGTSIANGLGNSNITFTTPVSRFKVGGTGSFSSTTMWAATTGGLSGASVPLCHDTVTLDANSFSGAGQTFTLDMPRVGSNITMAGITNSPTINNSTGVQLKVFGSLTLGTGFTPSNFSWDFRARSSVNYTSGGVALAQTLMRAFGGTVTQQDAANLQELQHDIGTWATNNFNLTILSYRNDTLGGTFAPDLQCGSSLITVTGNDVNSNHSSVWRFNTGAFTGTISAGTSTIKFTDTTSNTKTFAGGGKTYNNFWFAPGSSAGALNVVNSNTFNDFKDDGSVAHSVLFTAGTTTTVTTFTVSGSSGNVITIGSITAANHNLVGPTGPKRTFNNDWLSVSRSQASPSNTFFAGANSTDGGNNSGWVFTTVSVPIALTGQAATSAVRSVAPSSAVSLTGQAATSAQGTLSPNLSAVLTGQPVTSASGTLSPGTSKALTGQAAASAAGSLAYSSQLNLIGALAITTPGTLLPAFGLSLVGNAMVAAPGAVSYSSALPLTGLTIISAQGGMVSFTESELRTYFIPRSTRTYQVT